MERGFMGKKLVLAEKPSVGREIAKILNCHQKGNGCLIGPGHIVTWALGHLVTLADPEAYDDKYKTWRIEDLPMLPERMELVVIRESARQFKAVKDLMRQPEVEELIIATDAGREGELVARWIIRMAGWRKPVKRLWISSQTERAIREGFNNLKPGKEYENLFASAECRAEADWLVGLNVTRALTCKYNAQLSAGRVQTPTLAMVVERENEIKRFVPKDYWTVQLQTAGFSLIWQERETGQPRLFDRERAEGIAAKVSGQTARVTEVKREAKLEPPPLAYDLTELQRDANRKYGFSAKTTSGVMQQLYEHHKLVTYPRTDSRHLSEDIVPTLPERLRAIAVGSYAEAARVLLKSGLKVTKRLVDNSKVSDHHAIIPTEEPVYLSKLSPEELKVYDLIVKRFLAVLSPAFEYEQTTVRAEVAGERFGAKGKIVKSKGWRGIYDGGAPDEEADDDGPEQTLPEIKPGDPLKILSVRTQPAKTKPPARYTEATLLSAMEHPGKLIEDQKLREALDNRGGLGTPATRAEIIEKLFNSFYMERNGKEIVPTSKGIQLIGLVPAELKSAELTGKWEQQLTEISKGRADRGAFMAGIRGYAGQLVATVAGGTHIFRHDNLTRTKCPQCGKYLLSVKGKRGEMLVCQDRECGYRQNVSIQSNARCPQCHKKLELRGEGENKLFTCVCGYREKLSSFTKRREAEKGSGNKREVQQFLKRQDDEPLNTALADALAKLKQK
jgi:DNA topoisomerase-3